MKCITALLVLLCLIAPAASADWVPVTSGVDYQRFQGEGIDVHVARVDLTSNDLRVVATRESERGLRVSEYARKNKALIAINADYFDSKLQPIGLTIGPCGVWKNTKDTEREGVVAVGEGRVEIYPQKEVLEPESWMQTAVSGWPMLIRQCRALAASELPGSDGFTRSPHPRTAVGVSEDGQTLFFVVADGRRDGVPGMTLAKLARFMEQELGACAAMNLDGGGSSAMWVGDEIVNRPSGRAALMSIPVDLWTKVGRFGNRPLRTAHVVGDASGYPGAGIGLTVDTISDIVDEPIHAYARVSLGDLRRVIDSVGGIDVNITRGVYEYRAQQRFRPGTMRLNGLQATRYAYSPNIAGAAAADRFAREDRQQAVFIATLLKVLDEKRTIAELRDPFGSLTATNLEPQHLDRLRTALRRGGKDIRRISFAPHLDTYDVTSVVYRGEALVPRNGSFATLQRVADAALEAGVARVH